MVGEHLKPGARLYTDEAKAYEEMGEHEAVNHSARDYVGRDYVGERCIRTAWRVWSIVKRGSYGIYHKMWSKHLGEYVAEFVHRHTMGGQTPWSRWVM